MRETRTAWLDELQVLVDRYAGTDETIGAALDSMPDDVRLRALDLVELAGLADDLPTDRPTEPRNPR